MKNKKLTYVLLILVVGIWGGILYQIFEGNQEPKLENVAFIKTQKVSESTIEDSIVLLLNYRDPFLERKRVNKRPTKSTKSVKRLKKIEKIEITVHWPLVEYSGSISNSSKKSKMALIKINGKEHLMKEGDTQEGIEIARIFPDSITLAYMNSAKTIHK